MNIIRTILLALIFDCVGLHAQINSSQGRTNTVLPPAKECFHIYLLMGQSNMAGRDTNMLAEQPVSSRVLALNPHGEWVVARDPLHPDAGRIKAGVGPGMSFALEMLKIDTNVTIGLVPCAAGGTPLGRWVKGADLYNQALSRARFAAKAGAISGVLWHQGESDTRDQANAEVYEARLATMFKDLRADLGNPDLPIVVGQLGSFLPAKKWPYANTIRAAIKNMPTLASSIGYADSGGLGDKGDQLHFSAESQHEFGVRYAKAMLELRKK